MYILSSTHMHLGIQTHVRALVDHIETSKEEGKVHLEAGGPFSSAITDIGSN